MNECLSSMIPITSCSNTWQIKNIKYVTSHLENLALVTHIAQALFSSGSQI